MPSVELEGWYLGSIVQLVSGSMFASLSTSVLPARHVKFKIYSHRVRRQHSVDDVMRSALHGCAQCTSAHPRLDCIQLTTPASSVRMCRHVIC